MTSCSRSSREWSRQRSSSTTRCRATGGSRSSPPCGAEVQPRRRPHSPRGRRGPRAPSRPGISWSRIIAAGSTRGTSANSSSLVAASSTRKPARASTSRSRGPHVQVVVDDEDGDVVGTGSVTPAPMSNDRASRRRARALLLWRGVPLPPAGTRMAHARQDDAPANAVADPRSADPPARRNLPPHQLAVDPPVSAVRVCHPQPGPPGAGDLECHPALRGVRDGRSFPGPQDRTLATGAVTITVARPSVSS